MSNNKKRKQTKVELDLFKFFNIQLKEEKELKKLTDNQLKQYMCRLKRWDSCLETQLDFEKYKTKSLIDYNNALVTGTKKMIDQFKSDPQFETQFEKKYGKRLAKIEAQIEECIQGLEADKQQFFQLFNHKKKLIDVKEEEEEEVETKPSLKKVKKEIKTEIKEEFDDEINHKPNIKKEVKVEVKQEVKEEYEDMDYEDIKPKIKKEIKTELTPKVKVEVLSSDEEEYD